MANFNNKHAENINGKYFCTGPEDEESCLPCGLCYNHLPEVFAEDDEGNAYVHQQPSKELELEVEELIRDCPADAIGAQT